MNKPLSEHPKLLLDPYIAWTEKEGVPVTEDFGVDLLKCPTSHWPRFGVEGGVVLEREPWPVVRERAACSARLAHGLRILARRRTSAHCVGFTRDKRRSFALT